MRAAPALAALLLGACALPSLAPEPRAQLSVEVLSGFTVPTAAPPPRAQRVEILVDVTSSMETPAATGTARYLAARAAAARLMRSLPADAAVGLHALGIASVDGCQPAFRSSSAAPRGSRAELFERLDGLAPGGEGSLARAVDGLRVYLVVTDGLVGTRVVVMTDLGSECGGDLCQAVSDLVAGGGRVELVLFGEAPLPPCLAEFATTITWVSSPDELLPVFELQLDGSAAPALRGRADGGAVSAPAGRAWVTVDLEPPARIGPIPLAVGQTTRVRVIDFPALGTPVREWSWEDDAGNRGSGP